MGNIKWIGGFLGFMAGGALGGFIGFLIGSFVDNVISTKQMESYDLGEDYDNENGAYRRYASESEKNEGDRNSFLFSMLLLSAYIIKADGKVMHSEMEFIRNFLRTNFGENSVQQGEDIILKLFEQQNKTDRLTYQRKIQKCCAQIAYNLDYETRLQLMSFLVEIAKADGRIDTTEVSALKEICNGLRITTEDYNSLLNIGGNTIEEAYKVLGVSPNATNDEVKAAYKKLALKHHPDRVARLGEDVRIAAEKKFKEINEAKDIIYKSRGI